jgi:hypothetical protein
MPFTDKSVEQKAADVQRWIRQANRRARVAKDLLKAEFPSTIGDAFDLWPTVKACRDNLAELYGSVCEYFKLYDIGFGEIDTPSAKQLDTYDGICDSRAALSDTLNMVNTLAERLQTEIDGLGRSTAASNRSTPSSLQGSSPPDPSVLQAECMRSIATRNRVFLSNPC